MTDKHDTDGQASRGEVENRKQAMEDESSETGKTRGYSEAGGKRRPPSRDESVGPQARHFFPVLICLSGSQRGERRSIRAPRLTIGRGAKCDWQINDSAASREHLVIEHTNFNHVGEFPACYLSDLGSRNGTRVNGRPLQGRYLLEERDRFMVGSTTIGFFIRDEAEYKHDESMYLSATSDPLTKLDNRRQLRLHMKHHLARARRYDAPMTFLLLDLDHFKSLNDNHGHDVGDMALVHVADLLRTNLRENDLIARWGGEEFAICLPDCGLEEGIALAERLRQCVEETPFTAPNREVLRFTASVGGTSYCEGDTEETLFQRADQLLYLAKNTGRNRSLVAATVPDTRPRDLRANQTQDDSDGPDRLSFED